MIYLLLEGCLLMMVVMSIAWGLTKLTENAGLVDVVWTIGVGLVALLFSLPIMEGPELTPRQIVVAIVAVLWSLRLTVHLWRRNVGQAEDARYTALRTQWGGQFYPRLFGFLMAQALGGVLLDVSILAAAHNPDPQWGLLDLVALLIMTAALLGGAVADQQLLAFKQNPAHKGQICDHGLWSHSRHPNYFCEVLFWTGYPIFALSGGWITALAALIGPGLIYYFLRYVSGIPPLEEHMAQRYGEAFVRYCEQTPLLFPTLIRKPSHNKETP